MAKNNGGLTQPEVDTIVGNHIQRLEGRLRSLGCGTDVGCLAGKRHEQMHADKLNSEIENCKAFRKNAFDKEKVIANKFSEVLIMLNDVLGRMSEIMRSVDRNEKSVEDNKKEIGKLDTRLWVFFSAVVLMCVGTVGATYHSMAKISAAVKTINSVDIENQNSTETYMALLLEQIAGKPITQILQEHTKQKGKLDAIKK
jgi:hypothetical protein